jgi:hypothetical protein
MRAVADIDPRGAGLRAVTVVAWHATVICNAFGRDMDAHAARRTRFSTTLGLRDDASKKSPLDRESGAPSHTRRDGVAA